MGGGGGWGRGSFNSRQLLNGVVVVVDVLSTVNSCRVCQGRGFIQQ